MNDALLYQRVITLIKALNFASKSSFAEAIGVQKQNIDNIKRQKSYKIDLLEKIINKFPEANIEFLVAGIGEPIKKQKEKIYDDLTKLKENNLMMSEKLEFYKEKIAFLEEKIKDAEKRRSNECG